MASFRFPLADLHLTAIHQSFVIPRIGLQDFVVELARLIETILLDQKSNVVFLDLNICGVLLVKSSVFGGGFVDVAGGEIEIAQEAIARGIVGKTQGGATKSSGSPR